MNSSFSRDAFITFLTKGLSFILKLGTSILIARTLGPKGKGIYSLALLLPSMIVTFSHLGINLATVYYIAQRRYPHREVLGNNIWLAGGIGAIGTITGTVIILFFQERIIPGVPRSYLFLTLALIPAELLFSYLQHLLLGDQRIKAFNTASIAQLALTFVTVAAAIWLVRRNVMSAIIASIIAWLFADIIVLACAIRASKGISFRLNIYYIKSAFTYGAQAHLGNIFWDLTHRFDLFLVNGYLGPAAVGIYSLGVAIAEILWMISQAASTVLLPKVAAEQDENQRRNFTPMVARTVLHLTALGALLLALSSRWLIGFLYSESFLPAVRPLQILLFGIVALSIGRVLANDIAGRGRPILNTYITAGALVCNIALNLVWIPIFGIIGAALASSVSYILMGIIRIFIYCRLSNNYWSRIILPQRSDWKLYRKTIITTKQWLQDRIWRIRNQK